MTITRSQRETIQATGRDAVISSSMAPIVMGLSPYETRGDLYLRLTGQLPGRETTEAMRRGNEQEPITLARAAERLGAELETDPEKLEFHRGAFVSHPDALVIGTADLVEAKFSSVPAIWGEEETDEVPDWVWIQNQHQLFVAERETAHVMVALAAWGIEYRLFRVPRNEEWISKIVDECQAFLENHVWPGVPPEEAPSLGVLKGLAREKKLATNEVGAPLFEDWQRVEDKLSWCRRLLRQIEAEHEEVSARIVQSMGEADAIRVEGVRGEFAFRERRGRTTFSKSHPDKCELCGVGKKKHPGTRALTWKEKAV